MGPQDLLWFFFILSALQPAIKQSLLQASRTRLIGRIERLRGSRVILLVHRQETMSLLGFPVMRYIDINDAEEVFAGGSSWPHSRSRVPCATIRAR